MKRLILVLLLAVACFAFAACGESKGTGELCASNLDCENEICGFGPCPPDGPPCAEEGGDCRCLVCL